MGELWRRPGSDYRARDGWTFESSAGVITVSAVTNPSGDTIRVALTQGFLRSEDNTADALHPMFITQTDIDFSGKAVGTHYIYAEWNAGSPQLNTTQTFGDISGQHEFLIAVVVKESDAYHISAVEQRVYDIPERIQHVLLETEGVRRANWLGGLIIDEDGVNRYIEVTSGELYLALQEYDISAIDTDPGGGADTFDTYYGSWTKTTGVSQWPNTQYDNAGSLTTMTNNWYANLWWYLDTDGGLGMVYGTSQYANLASALLEDAPSSVPERFSKHGILIGKLTFKKSATSAETLASAFTTTFSGSAATDHGGLAGLTDDDHTQYPLLAGRAGGQTLIGGKESDEDLILQSTSNATKGHIFFGSNSSGFSEVNERFEVDGKGGTHQLLAKNSGATSRLTVRRTDAHGSGAEIGRYQFEGLNSTPANYNFGSIIITCVDNTVSSEDGKLEIYIAKGGSVQEQFRVTNDIVSLPSGHQLAVGTNSPAASAAVDITSTTGALLVPRMTTAQRNALTAVNGMIIYNTTDNEFNFYENSAWVSGSGLA